MKSIIKAFLKASRFVFWGLFIGTFIAWEPDKKEELKKEKV